MYRQKSKAQKRPEYLKLQQTENVFRCVSMKNLHKSEHNETCTSTGYKKGIFENSIGARQGSTLHDEKLLNASVTLVRCYRYDPFFYHRSFGMTLTTVTLTTAASTAASTAAL